MKNLRKRAASILEYVLLLIGIAALAAGVIVVISNFVNTKANNLA
jgi:hypothetical protein